ncbi:MAG: hypothetical protein KGH85_05250 [Thaumarchaeota archaeon]|nr:hypothetical protein [Nitrososphaerota archaeon]
MWHKEETNIMVKKDSSFYVGYYIEISQARGQGNTKAEAISNTKQAIILCLSYLADKTRKSVYKMVGGTEHNEIK